MFKGKIDFQALVSSGTTFEVDPSQMPVDESDEEVNKDEFDEEMLKHTNLTCLGEFEDDDVYDSKEPFEAIDAKMVDILGCEVRKRILREGYGNKPEEKCIVRVHYNAYLEYNEEPFDCTYARKKPHTFVIGTGQVIPGLDFAILSMNLNEKAQFLIKPSLAYGKHGCLGRIPGDATVLFEVELLEIIESGAAEDFENLPDDKKTNFAEVYKCCMARCAKGKDLFSRNTIAAVKEYNIAVSILERAQLENYEDQVKQQELLYKLHSNLLVCHTKLEQPKKACINFNRINEMSKGTDLKISAKAYFNNAKCLRMLGDYDLAKSRLQQAYNLEPRNPEILNEFNVIDELQKKYKEKQKKLAGALIGANTKDNGAGESK